MPKRSDLKTILVLGAGPIVIGQACEFDYSGVQACKALREEGFRVVLVNSNPATIMTDPEPENMLAAKFSLPYAVATAVVHNSTDITAFYPDRLQDPETLSLARRVDIVADPDMDLRRYDYPAAKVAVSLKDGRTLTEDVIAHHGDAQNPASREELVGKFNFLVQDVLGEMGAARVVETVGYLDALGDIRELTRLLKGS